MIPSAQQQRSNTHSDSLMVAHKSARSRKTALMHRVGIYLRRVRYIGAFLYWSARHLSFARGRWVAEFCEGKW